MTNKPVKIPGPDHPITITKNPKQVVVKVASKIIVDSKNSLLLKEASYPVVIYVPRTDADMSQLKRTDNATYCPYKGECSYYSISVGGEKSINAVWTYEAPFESVKQIKDHLAFYTDRVDSIEEK